MNHSFSSPINMAIKQLLVGFLILWSGYGLAAGWNDFTRDIGHGFSLWKTDSFHVCIDQVDTYAQVCGDTSKGNYGPVSGYYFTDEHLLVRTHGAKLRDNSEYFKTDIDREHFFIIKREVPSHGRNSAIGPLDRDEFYDHPAVPAEIQWEPPTRFDLSPRSKDERSALENTIITAIAWPLALLIFFGPIIIWPIGIFIVVRWIRRRWRMRSRDNT